MYERDYIKRLIQQLFDSIRKLLENPKEDNIEDIQIQYKDLYDKFLGHNYSFYYNEDIETIIESFSSQKDSIGRIEMLAELLYNDASLQNDLSVKNNLFAKSLALYKYIDENSDTYSIERIKRIETLSQKNRE